MVEISSSGSGEGPERVTFPAYSTPTWGLVLAEPAVVGPQKVLQ